MRTRAMLFFTGVAALAMIGSMPTAAGAATTHRDELIPLYDNANATAWQTACSQSNGSHGGSYIIADPFQGNGPGPGPVPSWSSVITSCYRYGRASVIGYVWTNYGSGGTASIPAIEQQINAWYAYYPREIAGIFFDGVSDTVPGTATSNKAFYQTLASYVHSHEGDNDEVVFNFGANPASGWMLSGSAVKNADIVVTFEGSYNDAGSNPFTAWTQASWELAYPANDFAALIYDAPDASACGSPSLQHVGYVYVGTWYDTLPPFWSQFLAGC
ncbi:MAG: spherulation-specific family 4 protein [Solirubrobacteraceae bacterium]